MKIMDIEAMQGRVVCLSHFTEADLSERYVGWLNDPEVVRYSNQRFKKHSLETCKAYLDSFKNSQNMFLKVTLKSSGVMVGTMTAYLSVPHQVVDMGIMIGDRNVWGKGVGYDAWEALLRWQLSASHVRKVTAGTMRVNIAMSRIIERSGMALEAVRPGQELLDGVPQDLLYYGIFKEERF